MTQFIGPTTTIVLENPTSGVLNVLVQEDLYSEWKVWMTGRVTFNTENDVSTANERITKVDHSMYTGQRAIYQNLGGSETIGLTNGTAYFVREIDRNTFELYDTKSNAEAGPSVTGRLDLTASGVGLGETHQVFVDNSKFPLAFRTVGGDPLTPGVEAGAYFFMQNQNGWRIISTDEDQTINYNGNLVGEDSAQSLINVTPGRSVLHLGLQPVTQRVDEILTQTQVAAYNGVVSVDVLSTNTGTVFPVGTRSTPVNNMTDALAIANANGFKGFEFRGSITLNNNFTDWSFTGISAEKNDQINLAGFDVDRSRFSGCGLNGSFIGNIEAVECDLNVVSGLQGMFRRCGLTATIMLAAGSETVFANCFSEVAGTGSPVIVTNGASSVNFRNYSGGLELRGVVAGTTISVDLDPGTITMTNADNTGGLVQIRGVGWKNIDTDVIGTTIIDRMFDIQESQVAFASLVGNANVSVDDLTVSILDRNLNNLRDLSVSADGRTRRIV